MAHTLVRHSKWYSMKSGHTCDCSFNTCFELLGLLLFAFNVFLVLFLQYYFNCVCKECPCCFYWAFILIKARLSIQVHSLCHWIIAVSLFTFCNKILWNVIKMILKHPLSLYHKGLERMFTCVKRQLFQLTYILIKTFFCGPN